MQVQHAQWVELEIQDPVTIAELSQSCGMSATELNELVDYCALVPTAPPPHERLFSAYWVSPLRSADKLRHDFDLDLFTVAILLENLRRIEVLERQVRSLQAHLPSNFAPGA